MINPFEEMAHQLAAQVSEQVLQNIRVQMSLFLKQGIKLSYSEAEAADILGMSKDSLAALRKQNGIGYSQTLGVPNDKNGRFVYLQHHLLDYLQRMEVKPPGKPTVKLSDVLSGQIYQKAA